MLNIMKMMTIAVSWSARGHHPATVRQVVTKSFMGHLKVSFYPLNSNPWVFEECIYLNFFSCCLYSKSAANSIYGGFQTALAKGISLDLAVEIIHLQTLLLVSFE